MEPIKNSNIPRQLSLEKTAAILDGATRVFLKEGYAGTSMDQVAAAAGVSKPTVYSHFQDKEGLFNALMEHMARKMQWTKFSQDLWQFSSELPESVLYQLANNVLDSCIDNPEMITFIRLVMGESGRFPELGKAFVQNADKPTLEALSYYLTTCPYLNLPDPEAAARTFMGTLIYFFITNQMLHGQEIVPMERERLVNHLVSLIMSLNLERQK